MAGFQKTITGVKNLGLCLHTSGGLAIAREELDVMVEETLSIQQGPPRLSDQALTFKRRVITVFGPQTPQGQAVLEMLGQDPLNSDWQEPGLRHHCLGPACCLDRQATVAKVQLALRTCLSLMRPHILKTNNWAYWFRACHFPGFFSHLHSLLAPWMLRTLSRISRSHGHMPLQHPVAVDRAASPSIDVNTLAGVSAAMSSSGALGEGSAEVQQEPDQEQADLLVAEEGDLAARRKEESERRSKALQFLCGPYVADELYIMSCCLLPERELISAMLRMEGATWQRKEMAKLIRGGARTFPLQELSKQQGGQFTVALQALQRLLHRENTAFAHVLHTEAHATLITTSLLCLAAGIYEVRKKLHTWPAKLFTLIDHPERAEALLQEAACTKDPFTVNFFKLFGTAASLQSPQCQATLCALQVELSTNTYSTECLHSKNLRRQKSRVLTNPTDLPQLSLWHQATAMPSWAHGLDVGDKALQGHSSKGRKRKGAQSAPKDEDALAALRAQHEGEEADAAAASVAATDQAKSTSTGDTRHSSKRKRGGGGGARAFIHMAAARGELKGHQGFPRHLFEQYRNLSDEEAQVYIDIGKKATSARKVGGQAFPTRKANLAFAPSSTKCAESERQPHPTTADELLARIQALKCDVRQKQLQKSKEGEDAGECTAEEDSAALQAFSAQRLPQLQNFLLSSTDGIKKYAVPGVTASLALGLEARSCSVSGSMEALAAEWEASHVGIHSAPLGRVQAEKALPCSVAGFCVCRGYGRWIALFLSKAMQTLKAACPPSSDMRELLMNGRILLLWSSAPCRSTRSGTSSSSSLLHGSKLSAPTQEETVELYNAC